MSNIKINDVFQRVQYAATNGQTQFAIPFPFFSDAYVIVWQDGIQLFPGGAPGQYAITGAGSPSGGLITLVTPAALDSIITIQGDMPIDRTSIYSATISNLTGSDLNGDFNREVVMMKQIETTQALLQLQYAPWALVSQDVTVTRDRYIPILAPEQVWRMNEAGTFIEAFSIGGAPAPVNSPFVTYTDDPTLENAQNLGLLTSGLLKQSVSTGVATLAIAIPGVDYLDPATLGTMALQDSDDVNITGGFIDNVAITNSTAALTAGTIAAIPVFGTDIVNKSYADSISAGFTFKSAVVASTTANLTATYANGASGVGATLTEIGNGALSIDGVAPALLARVLVKNQSTPAQNGIYIVSDQGSAGTPYILTRATDFDTAAEIVPGAIIFVQTGTTLANTSWVQTNPVLTVGTDPVQFIQFSQQYPLSMGNGGTGAALTATVNNLVYSTASAMALLATANSGVLVTSAGGVPSISTTLPAGLTIPGYAHSGVNADITSMTGLTGALRAPTAILDANGNEIQIFNAGVASAVNEFTFTNAATGNAPTIATTGGDSNINWDTSSKGTGTHISRSANTTAAIQWKTGTTYQHTTNWIPANTAQTRNITLPDSDGTMAYTSDIGAFLIATATASSSASVEFTSISGYTNYMLVLNNVLPATNGATLNLQGSINNGSSYMASSGDYFTQALFLLNTTVGAGASTTGTAISISIGASNGAGAGTSGHIMINGLNGSTRKGIQSSVAFTSSTGPSYGGYYNNAQMITASNVNALRLIYSAGNVASGNVQLYGFK